MAWREVEKGNRAFAADVFDHRLLCDVVVVDVDATDLVVADELLGLRRGRPEK